jgi:hypothetical protein
MGGIFILITNIFCFIFNFLARTAPAEERGMYKKHHTDETLRVSSVRNFLARPAPAEERGMYKKHHTDETLRVSSVRNFLARTAPAGLHKKHDVV